MEIGSGRLIFRVLDDGRPVHSVMVDEDDPIHPIVVDFESDRLGFEIDSGDDGPFLQRWLAKSACVSQRLCERARFDQQFRDLLVGANQQRVSFATLVVQRGATGSAGDAMMRWSVVLPGVVLQIIQRFAFSLRASVDQIM